MISITRFAAIAGMAVLAASAATAGGRFQRPDCQIAENYPNDGVGCYQDSLVKVTGKVITFAWENPRVRVVLEVKGADGTTSQLKVVVGLARDLSPNGWTRDTVKSGDELSLTGHPGIDGMVSAILAKEISLGGKMLPVIVNAGTKEKPKSN